MKLPHDAVAIDYLPAVTHAPGVGRYARELVRAAVRREDCPPLVLCELGAATRIFDDEQLGLSGVDVRRVQRRVPQRLLQLGHRVARLGADDLCGRPAVFHRARPLIPPLRRAAEVLPLAELPPPGTDAERLLAQRVRRAEAIVVFSDDYRSRAVEHLGADPARVHFTPVGADHWKRDLGEPAGGPRRRIIVLGAMRSARRPLTVLAAFERLVADGVDAELLWVGRGDDAGGGFRVAWGASPARDRIQWMEHAVERDMPSTVAEASVLLHLTRDEGTAVTPLEALAMGTAVVAERVPAFTEFLGDDAHWTSRDPRPAELAEALAAGLEDGLDPARRAARARRGAQHTWDRCAAATIPIWRGLTQA